MFDLTVTHPTYKLQQSKSCPLFGIHLLGNPCSPPWDVMPVETLGLEKGKTAPAALTQRLEEGFRQSGQGLIGVSFAVI